MYFKHEIKTKIIDGIINKSQKWDWFVEYLEENVSFNTDIKSLDDFNYYFREAIDTFQYVAKIYEVYDESFVFRKKELIMLNEMVLFYLGKKKLEQLQLKGDFEKTLAMLVYAGKIYNQSNNKNYLFFRDIFTVRNIYQKDDISGFVDEADTIIRLLNSLDYNATDYINTFNDNINCVEYKSEGFIDKYKDELCNVNCFSYLTDIRGTRPIWEEEYVLNMVGVNYDSGKLCPKVEFSGGQTIPDMSMWTESVLMHIRKFFDDETIDFVVDSIEYALYKKVPSSKTIEKHFDLVVDYYDNKTEDFHCSSLEFIISFFNDKRVIDSIPKNCIKNYSLCIEKITDFDFLIYLNNNGALKNNSLRKRINEYLSEEAEKIEDIQETSEFLRYLKNNDIIRYIDKNIFEKVSDKFEIMIEKETSILLASLFYDYFRFLLKIRNNKDIISKEIRCEILYIRSLWQTIYYSQCINIMHTFEHSVKIANKEISNISELLINKPVVFANSILKLDDKLLDRIIHLSEHPLVTLFSNMIIVREFPYPEVIKVDENHRVDMIYREMLEKLINNNQHRFLNPPKIEDDMRYIYRETRESIIYFMSLFVDTEKLYDVVRDNNRDAELIDYSRDIKLAHITQLFPMLENKIREYGELFGILPIREDDHTKLKEPYSVLSKIISDVYKETNSLAYVSDLVFIHFCMFAENGLNIRNDCVHGNGYRNKGELLNALKITLICINMLDWRFSRILQLTRGESEL